MYTPDALKHTVAGELVHDERGLHVAGLLVGVGHKATHKVGVAAVQGLNICVLFITTMSSSIPPSVP